jgi:hypothetical protein
MPKIQKRKITTKIALVNRGSLDMYERARSVLKLWTLGMAARVTAPAPSGAFEVLVP